MLRTKPDLMLKSVIQLYHPKNWTLLKLDNFKVRENSFGTTFIEEDFIKKIWTRNTNQEFPCGHTLVKICHKQLDSRPGKNNTHHHSGYPKMTDKLKYWIDHCSKYCQKCRLSTTFVASYLPPNPTSKIATSTCSQYNAQKNHYLW